MSSENLFISSSGTKAKLSSPHGLLHNKRNQQFDRNGPKGSPLANGLNGQVQTQHQLSQQRETVLSDPDAINVVEENDVLNGTYGLTQTGKLSNSNVKL